MFQGRRWRTATLRSQTASVKLMVPRLRRIVEDGGLVVLSGGRSDDCLQRKVGERRTGDQLVQFGGVPLVVLALVEPNRVGGDYRIECVLRVRQRLQHIRRGLVGQTNLGNLILLCGPNGRPAPIGYPVRKFMRQARIQGLSCARNSRSGCAAV